MAKKELFDQSHIIKKKIYLCDIYSSLSFYDCTITSSCGSYNFDVSDFFSIFVDMHHYSYLFNKLSNSFRSFSIDSDDQYSVFVIDAMRGLKERYMARKSDLDDYIKRYNGSGIDVSFCLVGNYSLKVIFPSTDEYYIFEFEFMD